MNIFSKKLEKLDIEADEIKWNMKGEVFYKGDKIDKDYDNQFLVNVITALAFIIQEFDLKVMEEREITEYKI